mgnify:CR=1 FL=1
MRLRHILDSSNNGFFPACNQVGTSANAKRITSIMASGEVRSGALRLSARELDSMIVVMADLKVDRTKLTVHTMGENSDDQFWWSQTPAERIAAIQVNRQAAYGKSRASATLQRVLEVARRPSGSLPADRRLCGWLLWISTDTTLDGVPVRLISLRDLRRNKHASGRYKDLDDLEHLPEDT